MRISCSMAKALTPDESAGDFERCNANCITLSHGNCKWAANQSSRQSMTKFQIWLAVAFQLRRLRAIGRPVAPVFTTTTTVHAFTWSRVDYCNSLLMSLSRLLHYLKSVVNIAAGLIHVARLPQFTSIFTQGASSMCKTWFVNASWSKYGEKQKSKLGGKPKIGRKYGIYKCCENIVNLSIFWK